MSDERIQRLEAEVIELCLEKRELKRQLKQCEENTDSLANEYHELDENYKQVVKEREEAVKQREEWRKRCERAEKK
jgi:chromosome segregation ATPase